MLLTVEGGGFFSASASGYSKFLSVFLLGRGDEERPMRVLPWNHYQLVEQDSDSDIQLALKKKRAPHRRSFFICFGRPSAGVDRTSPPTDPAQSDFLEDPSAAEKGRDSTASDAGDENITKLLLKSSLKKHPFDCSRVGDHNANGNGDEACDIREDARKRKIQWTDACGKDLAEIREFEPSERGMSDDESEREGYRRCECVIQ